MFAFKLHIYNAASTSTTTGKYLHVRRITGYLGAEGATKNEVQAISALENMDFILFCKVHCMTLCMENPASISVFERNRAPKAREKN